MRVCLPCYSMKSKKSHTAAEGVLPLTAGMCAWRGLMAQAETSGFPSAWASSQWGRLIHFSWIQISGVHRSVGVLSPWASLLMGTSFPFLLQFQLLVDVALYSELYFFISPSSPSHFLFPPAAFRWICLQILPFRPVTPFALENTLQILP